jgi:hypothetical protein
MANSAPSASGETQSLQPPQWLLRAGITVVVTALYLVVAFRGWRGLEDLSAMFPKFSLLGFFVGFAIAGLPVRRQVLTAFWCTAPTPVLSLAAYLFIEILVASANAGVPEGFRMSGWLGLILEVIFLLGAGLVLALFAAWGCYFGLVIRESVAHRLRRGQASSAGVRAITASHPGESDSDAVRAARIGARATVIVGVVGAVATVATALLVRDS